MRHYYWIWGYFKKHRFLYAFGLSLTVIASALALINPYVTGLIVKSVFTDGDLDALPGFLLVMVAVTLIKNIIRYGAQMIYEHTSQSVIFQMRRSLYDKCQRQSFSFYDTNRVGDIMSRMTDDMNAIRHFISWVVAQTLESVLIFTIAIIVMFFISWRITLFMLAVAVFTFICTMKQSRAVKPAFGFIREQFAKLNTVCQENISGNRVVKAFAKEEFEKEKFGDANRAFYDANVAASRIWARFLPVQDFLSNFLSVLLVIVGGLLAISGKLEVWKLVSLNAYLWAVNNPLRMIGWLVNDIQRFFASYDKMMTLVRSPVSVKNKENPVIIPRLSGKIEFRNVSFAYRDAKVLNNVSFSVEPGETVGIVGSTGSGKTTLMNLLCRFYDVTSGEVLVDGYNVRDVDLRCLRRDISSAMQDVFLFSDTIEGNVVYGVPDAPMEDVYVVAEIADADAFIRETEEGYDTVVGERGVGLSGGQKQRVSLARAVAVAPSVLILDDTTSAVDMETEAKIQKHLSERFKGATKFIIAHRISSVRTADKIFVLEKGEIIETGTHDELIKQNGYYSGLFKSQYGDAGVMDFA